MTQITLPWPPKELSPNSRVKHLSATAKRKRYKSDCFFAAREAGLSSQAGDRLHVRLVFHPPNNVRRDLDNMLGSVKYGLDALSTATGVDDSHWTLTIERGEVRKGGAVVVTVEAS